MPRFRYCAALIGACLAVPANAADMRAPYSRAPYYAPSPAYDWSGFYIGGNLGYAWGEANASASVGGLSLDATQKLTGAAGGLQGGVNWQSGIGLLGIEGDFQLTSQEKDFAYAAPGVTASGFNRLPWFATLRGRAGIVVDQWLVYGTGGLAFTQMKTTGNATLGGTPVALNFSEPQAGWVLGGGIETALWATNWTAKIEYLHFDSIDFSLPSGSTTTRSHANNDVVRLGVNYRFGTPR